MVFILTPDKSVHIISNFEFKNIQYTPGCIRNVFREREEKVEEVK